MSTIEFVLIPISIVVGLAMARILEGLYIISESEKRYWVHTLWLCNKLGQVFIYIWAWRLGGGVGAVFVDDPTFWDLIVSMCTPAIIFLQSLALLGPSPSGSEDWEAKFYSSRTRFFALNAVVILITGISSYEFGTGNLIPLTGLFLLNGVALATANRRVHAAIAVIAAIVFLIGVGRPILQLS